MVETNAKRIVVKIGSSLLVDSSEGLKREWLNFLCEDISQLQKSGSEVMLVSSGAIALGRAQLGLPNKTLKLNESQAAAATGQILLSRAYSEALGQHGLQTGQILLTIGDTEERRRYINARETISTLLKLGAVPIVNENDSVATSEIKYGDNDRLAARVATMIDADLLILLSDIDGFYSGIPGKDESAKRFDRIEQITPEIEAMAGQAASQFSRGGMITKLEAGKIATSAGTQMVITSGEHLHPLKKLFDGGNATWFDAQDNPASARKKWISGQLETNGELVIDEGAQRALNDGKSLLAAGVSEVKGEFSRGDMIAIISASGERIGCGLSAYDASDAAKIAKCRSDEVESILGIESRGAMIHRDNLVIKANTPASEQIDE